MNINDIATLAARMISMGFDKGEAIDLAIAVSRDAASIVTSQGSTVRNFVLSDSVRSIGNGQYRLYGVKFNDAATRDLYGTYFDKDTNYRLGWFDKRPWLYHHGMHDQLRSEGLEKIGTLVEAGIDEHGVFLIGELDRRHKYLEELEVLADAGLMFPSSGTLDYMARVASDGHVEDWPIVEVSSTVTPGNPLADAAAPEVLRAFRAVTQTMGNGGNVDMTKLSQQIRDLLSRRNVDTEDVESDTDAAQETIEVVEATEAEVEVVDTTEVESSTEESFESSAENAEMSSLPDEIRSFIKDAKVVIRAMDETIQQQGKEIHDLQQLIIPLAQEEPVRAKNALSNRTWFDSLYSVTRSVGDDVMGDESLDQAVQVNGNGTNNRTSQDAAPGSNVFTRLSVGN